MKKLLKILTVLLIAMLAVTVFASCGGSDSKKLIVATNAEFPPFESKDENDNIVGFDIDLINKIAEKLDMEVELNNMDFEPTVSSVQTGASDIAITGMTITAERLESVNFSEPYYNASQVLIVNKDDTVFTGTTKAELDEALKGKTIGVCEGFTGGDYVEGSEAFPGIENATKKSFTNINLAILDLKNGAVDAVIMDDVVAKNASNVSQNVNDVKVIDVPLSTEQYGIAIGKDNTELKNKIDNAIKELKDEGYIDDLIEKWINN